MRLKVIACETLTRELGYLGASSPHVLDITWLRQRGRADSFESLLQGCIDKTDEEGPGAYDAIVLALGADGLYGVTSQWFPLIAPRVHDCAALLLGSAQRYRDIFEHSGGVLCWYTPGGLERGLPDGVFSGELARYALPCGAENARGLLKLERDWERFRGAAAFVQLPGVPGPDFSARCIACAAYLDWPITVHEGDPALLRGLLDGAWDDGRFLTVPPARRCAPSFHGDILRLAL